METSTGATVSVRTYCHEAFVAVGSNSLGADSRSTMAADAANRTATGPSIGCGKLKTKSVGLVEVAPVAGLPLISRSPGSTPSTGSLKATVIWLRLETAPGAGVLVMSVGALEATTDTLTGGEEVSAAPRLSVATAVNA